MWKSTFAAAVSAVLLPSSWGVLPATAATDQPAATTTRPLTPGQIAARERQKKCAAEWHEAKDANKVPEGMTWPKFWSACNKRLKGKIP